MVAAAAATSILSLCGGGHALADSQAGGTAKEAPGVLSGNHVQAPVHVPVNACGNSVDVVAALDPAFGNSCADASAAPRRRAHAAPYGDDDSGYGDSGYGDSGYGDSGYGDSGYGGSGYGDHGNGNNGPGDDCGGYGDTCGGGDHSTPPGGGHSSPPGGGHSMPPGGGHSSPPGGGHSMPPGGGHSSPPGGGHSSPPGGGHSSPPPGGGHSSPPGGGHSSPPPGGGHSSPPPGGGHSRLLPVVGIPRLLPVAGTRRLLPVVGIPRLLPVAGTRRLLPVVGTRHRLRTRVTARLRPEAGTPPRPAAGTPHLRMAAVAVAVAVAGTPRPSCRTPAVTVRRCSPPPVSARRSSRAAPSCTGAAGARRVAECSGRHGCRTLSRPAPEPRPPQPRTACAAPHRPGAGITPTGASVYSRRRTPRTRVPAVNVAPWTKRIAGPKPAAVTRPAMNRPGCGRLEVPADLGGAVGHRGQRVAQFGGEQAEPVARGPEAGGRDDVLGLDVACARQLQSYAARHGARRRHLVGEAHLDRALEPVPHPPRARRAERRRRDPGPGGLRQPAVEAGAFGVEPVAPAAAEAAVRACGPTATTDVPGAAARRSRSAGRRGPGPGRRCPVRRAAPPSPAPPGRRRSP